MIRIERKILNAKTALVESRAVLCGGDPACGAVQEPRVDPILQLDHGSADARARQSQCLGGAGKTGAIDDADEDAEKVDMIQRRSRLLFASSDR